jgi:hypothetical protein
MSGDIIGAVASISEGEKAPEGIEVKMIETAANFLSRQLDE